MNHYGCSAPRSGSDEPERIRSFLERHGHRGEAARAGERVHGAPLIPIAGCAQPDHSILPQARGHHPCMRGTPTQPAHGRQSALPSAARSVSPPGRSCTSRALRLGCPAHPRRQRWPKRRQRSTHMLKRVVRACLRTLPACRIVQAESRAGLGALHMHAGATRTWTASSALPRRRDAYPLRCRPRMFGSRRRAHGEALCTAVDRDIPPLFAPFH
jgi:hypothetical protein